MRENGFTLVELLVVLAVAAVLMVLAGPSFYSLWRSTQVATVSNDFLAAVHQTRMSAISRNRLVTMCTSVDGETCAQKVHWHSGWIVFEDRNWNGSRDAQEPVIQVHEALGGKMRVVGNGGVRDVISYQSDGSSRRASGALLMGTVALCPEGEGEARQIVINAAGRPRVERLPSLPELCLK